MEIQDDLTVKFGNEKVNVPEIVPYATRGQLDFICSFLYPLSVFEPQKNSSLRELVMRLYRKMDDAGMEAIRQNTISGTSGVRPEDILAILYRLRFVRFKAQ